MSNELKIYVVIPAAGSGHRVVDCETPKQYSIVCDKPLIYHTINAFLRIKWIDKIIVVSDSQNRKLMDQIIASISHQNRVDCVNGSTTRHRSISLGIEAISLCQIIPDIVVIHDGARPLVDETLLNQLVSSALKYGASGPICKLTSTVLSVNNDLYLEKALDRSQYYASEMPQCFKYNLIKEAYNKCTTHDYEFGTECLDLVHKYSDSKVKLIEANASQLWKVTFKKDLYTAEGILSEQKDILLHCDFLCEYKVNYKFIKDFKDNLEKTFANVVFFNNSSSIKFAYNPFIVHILIQFCNSWKDILEKCISKCDSLIYVIITVDELINSCFQDLIRWAKSKRNDIKNFYVIHCNNNELQSNEELLIKRALFLAKRTPVELSGQIFFI